MPEPRKSNNLDLAQCAGLGLALALTAGLGAYAGYQLDRWLQTEPFLLITGSLLGVAAGMTNVIRTVNRLQSRSRDREAP